MRLTSLFLLATLVATSASAASYVKTDGTIVDPILDQRYDIPHSYSVANLEPRANLSDADLEYATFNNSAVLFGGQTVLQHNFDSAGLPDYLMGSQGARCADKLTMSENPPRSCWPSPPSRFECGTGDVNNVYINQKSGWGQVEFKRLSHRSGR